MGKSGKSDSKKVKSDRINALRKQYDSFLEEDRKRKERNNYILGRLDKMRTCDKLIMVRSYRDPFAIDLDPPVLLNSRPSNTRKDNELQQFRRNYSVEPPLRTVDELELMRLISKKYILIPKREQNQDDRHEFIFHKNKEHENDWKSKYDILTQLKREEKEINDDDTGKLTEIDANSVNDSKACFTSAQEPEIPERDTANNNIAKLRNNEDYKDILKPMEHVALKNINDANNAFDDTIHNLSNTYGPLKDETSEKQTNQQPQQSEEETLIRASQKMRRPQTYIETEVIDDKRTEETKTSQVDPKIGLEVKQVKEVNQEYPIFEEDYPTEVVNREDFVTSVIAPVHDVNVHSQDPDQVHVDTLQPENSEIQESYNAQVSSPDSNAIDTQEYDSQYDLDISRPDKENIKKFNSDQILEDNQEYAQRVDTDGYNMVQSDYEQSALEVKYDENVFDVNYDQNAQVPNYEQSTTSVVEGNYDQIEPVTNYNDTLQDVTYSQNAQDSTYEQTLQDVAYEENTGLNYTDGQTYGHNENYPDQSQVVGENYDQNYPIDGVYQPDGYATDQAYTESVDQNYEHVQNQPIAYDHELHRESVDQNYEHVQNQPIAYDHDVTQQQYDQNYAEQYSAVAVEHPQMGDEPQQSQQEFDQSQIYDQSQVYEQYQNEQDTVGGVQQQLDTEDGFVEQNAAEQENTNETVPEEAVTVETT